MAKIEAFKKIQSNYNGQTPSTGKDVEDAFNENFETVRSSVNSAYDDIAQMEFDLSIRVNVPIVFDAAGYYRRTSPTKTLVESGTLNSMSIPVSGGDIFICSFKLGVGSSMAGIMFFDSAGNNKGYLYQGDGQEYQNVLISVPTGLDITEMAYCSVINWENNKIEKLSTDIDGAIKKVSSDVSELQTFENTYNSMLEEIKDNPNVNLISLDSVEVGYYYNKESSLSDGKTASLPYSSLLLQVQVGQTYKASGRVAKWPAVFVFYDSEGSNKGYAYSGDSNGDIQYTDVFVTVPDGATQMVYQYKQDYPHYLGICDYNYGGKVNELQGNVIAIEESLQAFDDKYSPVLGEIKENPNVNLISLDSAEVGYYYNKGASLSDGRTASSSYSSLLLQAQEGQLYKASGRVGATPAVFVFYDSDGNNKGYAYSGDSSGDIQYTDVLVTVPDGATQMVYQYKQDYPHYLGLCDYDYYSPIKGLQEEVQEIQSNVQELEKIKKLTKLANVYDYEEIGVVEGVINTSGNITPGGFSTGLIPIKADHFYYLSNRYAGAVKSIRCIADNGTTRSKVRVASTGLEPDSGIYYYLPSVDGATSVSNGQFKTSPTAAYLQISLTALSATELEDYYKIMLEDVGWQYNPDFIPSDYTSNNIVINDALLEYPVKPVIKRVESLENSEGLLKVLLIGSSHGMNTIGQFPILAYHSRVDVICANAYQGSLSLQQVANYCITESVFKGWYKKFSKGIWNESQSVTIKQMLQDEKWDFISVQRSASEDMTWNEEQVGYLETILAYITANTNYTPTIVFNSGFADSYSIARRTEQQADTEVIWATAQQVKAAYGIDIIPMAPALQLVRNNDTLASLGTYRYNMLSCDSQHLDQGIGMYVSGCICFNFFLKHLRKNVLSCNYLPTIEDMMPFWYDVEKFTAIEEQYAKEIRKIVNLYFYNN